jgi:predicted membrane protein
MVRLRSCGAQAQRRIVSQIGAAICVQARAQGLVEYGLILLMIVVVCVAIITVIGLDVSEIWYQKVVNSWPQ